MKLAQQTLTIGTLGIEKKIWGFTLAEVLITLTVIGVIAALTIPSLLQNIQDAQYHMALKEVYSQLNQAMTRAVSDNGGTIAGVCTSDTDNDCFRNIFLTNLNYVKRCDGPIASDCWASNPVWFDGSSAPGAFGSGFILNNGASAYFYLNKANCNSSFGNYFNRCGGMGIDVNGLKPPNMIGKDIYYIHILANQILPYGINGTKNDGYSNSCIPSGSEAGKGCAAKYLRQ